MNAVKHIDDLDDFLKKNHLSKNDVVLVGGAVLAVKGVRTNVDLDFSIPDPGRVANGAPGPNPGKKYAVINEHLDQYFDRYAELGITDELLWDEKLFFTHDEYQYVLPEIEIAYRILVKQVNEKDLAKIEAFIGIYDAWDWALFRKLLQHYYDARGQRGDARGGAGAAQLIRMIKAGLKRPRTALRVIIRKFRTHRTGMLPPKRKLAGQLTTMMPTAALLGNHFLEKNGEFFRYDVLMRYCTIDALRNDDREFIQEYKRMQQERNGSDTIDDFRRLTQSIQEQGFLRSSPIPISQDGCLVEGAHRLACALYFDIPEVPVRIQSAGSGGYFGRQWFVDRGFDEKLIIRLDDMKRRLFLEKGLYFPVIFWPSAKAHFADMATDVRKRHQVMYERELQVRDFGDFVERVYQVDDIAEWKVGLKRYLMEQYESSIYVMLLEVPQPCFRPKQLSNSYLSTAMESLKREVRSAYKDHVEGYFYDIIMHTGDNHEHNRKILALLTEYTECNRNELV